MDEDIEDCWQEVDIAESPAPAPPAGKLVDYGALQEEYRAAMGRARATASALAAMGDECFDPVAGGPLEHVQLGVLRPDVLRPAHTGSICTLRARGAVRGRPERYAHAARDFWAATRLEWDKQLASVEQHESFGDMHYCTATLPMPSSNLALGTHAYARWLHGLVAFDRHRASGVYRVVFRSAEHPVWSAAAPPRTVATQVQAGFYVCSTGDDMCDVTVVVDVLDAPVGSWFNTLARARLCEMLRLWVYAIESAVLEWDHYYGRRGRDPQRKE